jgi:hypothetical protein
LMRAVGKSDANGAGLFFPASNVHAEHDEP